VNARVRQGLAGFVTLASSALLTVPASAQDASDLVKEGVQLRREGHGVEALAVFERALAMEPTPRNRAQVALAEQALGFWVEAERDLSAALAAGEGTWFAQHQDALNKALDAIRRRLATLVVDVNVDGAELWINGVRAGTAPMPNPIRIVAGSVVVEARADGYAPQTHRLEIDPGAETNDRLELTPLPVAEPVSRPAASEPAPILSTRSPDPSNPNATARRTAAWISLGAAAALGAGGAAALLVRNDNATAYDDDSRCFYGSLTRDQRCGSYRQAATIAETLAIAQFAAAGVGIAAATFLFLNEPKDRGPHTGSACSVGVGVTCQFAF
jgi:hypothetical protein